MGLIDLGAIIVAAIAALGAWAAQRSSAKASRINTTVSGRLEAERGAYERARVFDVETIERQAALIEELRRDNDNQATEIQKLYDQNESLRRELVVVKRRVSLLEHLTPEWERLLNERAEAEVDDQEQ